MALTTKAVKGRWYHLLSQTWDLSGIDVRLWSMSLLTFVNLVNVEPVGRISISNQRTE